MPYAGKHECRANRQQLASPQGATPEIVRALETLRRAAQPGTRAPASCGASLGLVLKSKEAHEQILLLFRQMRIPHVEDENDADSVAGIESLMLDRVVKRERLAFYPPARFAAHPEPAIRRHHQGQVNERPCIRNTGVRRNPRPGLQDREKC